ncbi:MAG: hypothetical protein LUF04_00050 [Bacteroides sp.]|nr:hypothetical protein [Bacteroides sp.]
MEVRALLMSAEKFCKVVPRNDVLKVQVKLSGNYDEAGMETLANYRKAQTLWQVWTEQIPSKTNLWMSETNVFVCSSV